MAFGCFWVILRLVDFLVFWFLQLVDDCCLVVLFRFGGFGVAIDV